MSPTERTLLVRSPTVDTTSNDASFGRKLRDFLLFALMLSFSVYGAHFVFTNGQRSSQMLKASVYHLGRSHHHGSNSDDEESSLDLAPAERRCDLVRELFFRRDSDKTEDELEEAYKAQSKDSNVFFRATAHLFWHDFVAFQWEDLLLGIANTKAAKYGTTHTTWTWVTGDQHLSNFGAWKNRHADLVFGVNDFDEAAIYDFHVDLLRIAVSICNHADTNEFSDREIDHILTALTDSYVGAVEAYARDDTDDEADLFELTPDTTTGKLRKFLEKTNKKRSKQKQLRKFTTIDVNSTGTGGRTFLKGPIGLAHPKSRLAAVPPDVYQQIERAFGHNYYGATLMKVGWHVRDWDDNFYKVLDIAERVGSGVGSFGADRYYVLLNGTDDLLQETEDAAAVILDVKFQPEAAVMANLNEGDLAWYGNLFRHPAERVVTAQRKLTSYTDPFTGWILLRDNETNTDQSFTVRQRSPWKDGFEISDLKDVHEFVNFVKQIGKSTATSHVRGSVGKPPGDFKTIVADLLGGGKHYKWGHAVRDLAKWYHTQVLLDYECFQGMVESLSS